MPVQGDSYAGTVVALSPDSIVISSPGWTLIKCVSDPNGGDDREVVTVVGPQPPRQFIASPAYTAGKRTPFTMPGHSYRLEDVKVGDGVRVKCAFKGGCWTFDELCIYLRPGGKVPVAPEDRSFVQGPYPHHERAQAFQDWAEHGTPLPTKFHPGGEIPGVAPEPRPAGTPGPPGNRWFLASLLVPEYHRGQPMMDWEDQAAYDRERRRRLRLNLPPDPATLPKPKP